METVSVQLNRENTYQMIGPSQKVFVGQIWKMLGITPISKKSGSGAWKHGSDGIDTYSVQKRAVLLKSRACKKKVQEEDHEDDGSSILANIVHLGLEPEKEKRRNKTGGPCSN